MKGGRACSGKSRRCSFFSVRVQEEKKNKNREGGLLGGHSDLTQEAVHLPLM